jgi:hypothetical protein
MLQQPVRHAGELQAQHVLKTREEHACPPGMQLERSSRAHAWQEDALPGPSPAMRRS